MKRFDMDAGLSAQNNDVEQVFRSFRYIGVHLEDFNLRNNMFLRNPGGSIHGIGHIYRTMTACAMLGERLKKPRSGLLAMCGAFIHDLARVNDDIDPEHGSRAAEMFFHQFEALWNKYELTDKEREFVKQAVQQHSTCEWMQPADEGYDVMAILKDADALDRCRLGDDGLDPEFLRYSQSRNIIQTIIRYYNDTQGITEDITFAEFVKLYGSDYAVTNTCQKKL